METTRTATTHFIEPGKFLLMENALGNPDLIQSSVSSDCKVTIVDSENFPLDELEQWPTFRLVSADIKLKNGSGVYYIYICVPTAENTSASSASIGYSIYQIDRNGYKIVNGAATDEQIGKENYKYYPAGTVGAQGSDPEATTTPAGAGRVIQVDLGVTPPDATLPGDLSDYDKIFQIDKVDPSNPASWLLTILTTIKTMTARIINVTSKLIFGTGDQAREVTDVAVAADKGKEEKIQDTILASTAWANAEFIEKFLRKDKEDQTEFLIKFLKGIELGKFISGVLGTGGAIQIDEDGCSHAEFDYLTIRKLAIFIELIIQEAKHVGGMLIVSPSGMTVSKVEETDTAYRCYFDRTDGNRTISNQFTVGTQARRQTFNLTNQAYYWRLVTAVGDDYVDLSKTDCDTGSTIPQAGDELVGLGHRTDKARQSAIIISAFGTDSPSIKYYQGIDSYNLVDRAVKMDYYDPVSGRFKSVTYGDTYVGAKDKSTYVQYDQENGVEVKGVLHIENGSTGAGNIKDLPEEVQKAAEFAVKVGGVNLLLNSGFTGNYETEELEEDTMLAEGSEMYSKALLHWSGMATVQEDAESASGRSAVIGSLSQSVNLITDETYVISYKAKGEELAVSCGDYSVTQPLTSEYQRYTHKFTHTGTGAFLISGTATVCDLQLERGTIATDWCQSPQDNDKSMAEFQMLKYLADAIKNGSVDIIGGLVLANVIQLGNYRDGALQKVTAGLSGIYNDNDDVYTWGGGTMEQAIYTVMQYKKDPRYLPTEEELINMAKVVITHGGRAILNDVILRGYIYALGGLFKGKVEIAGGKILLNEDGSGQLADGSIKWDKDGNTLVCGNFSTLINGSKIEIGSEKIDGTDYIVSFIKMFDVNGKERFNVNFKNIENGVPTLQINSGSSEDVYDIATLNPTNVIISKTKRTSTGFTITEVDIDPVNGIRFYSNGELKKQYSAT